MGLAWQVASLVLLLPQGEVALSYQSMSIRKEEKGCTCCSWEPRLREAAWQVRHLCFHILRKMEQVGNHRSHP